MVRMVTMVTQEFAQHDPKFYILCRIIFRLLDVNFGVTDAIINVLQSFRQGAFLTTLAYYVIK